METLRQRIPPGADLELRLTLLDIIEAVEGPVRGHISFQPGAGDAGVHKKLSVVCEQAADKTRKALQAVKLSQLAAL